MAIFAPAESLPSPATLLSRQSFAQKHSGLVWFADTKKSAKMAGNVKKREMISSYNHKWVADAVKRENLKSDAAVFVCLSAGPLSKEGGGCYSTFGLKFLCLPLLNGSSCDLFVSSYLNNLYRGAAEKSYISEERTRRQSTDGGFFCWDEVRTLFDCCLHTKNVDHWLILFGSL